MSFIVSVRDIMVLNRVFLVALGEDAVGDGAFDFKDDIAGFNARKVVLEGFLEGTLAFKTHEVGVDDVEEVQCVDKGALPYIIGADDLDALMGAQVDFSLVVEVGVDDDELV